VGDRHHRAVGGHGHGGQEGDELTNLTAVDLVASKHVRARSQADDRRLDDGRLLEQRSVQLGRRHPAALGRSLGQHCVVTHQRVDVKIGELIEVGVVVAKDVGQPLVDDILVVLGVHEHYRSRQRRGVEPLPAEHCGNGQLKLHQALARGAMAREQRDVTQRDAIL